MNIKDDKDYQNSYKNKRIAWIIKYKQIWIFRLSPRKVQFIKSDKNSRNWIIVFSSVRRLIHELLGNVWILLNI